MPAPDRATLYNVEDPVEAAVKTLLEAGGVTPCFAQRETANLPGSRVDIQLRLGQCIGERENAWNAQLILNIWTDRSKDAPTVHGYRRGQIRNILSRVPPGQQYHPDFDATLLPYHVLNRIAHSGMEPQVNIADDLDLSALTYDLVVSIRPSAFPV